MTNLLMIHQASSSLVTGIQGMALNLKVSQLNRVPKQGL